MKKTIINIDNHALSPWSMLGFSIDGRYFPTHAHYLTYRKAKHHSVTLPDNFWDVLTPQFADDVGRGLHLNEELMSEILYEIIHAKIQSYRWVFTECYQEVNIDVLFAHKDPLLGTGCIVYGDKHPEHWRGRNLLGKIITDVIEKMPPCYYVDINTLTATKGLISSFLSVLNDKELTPQEKKDMIKNHGLNEKINKTLISLGYPALPDVKSLKEAIDIWPRLLDECYQNIIETEKGFNKEGIHI